MSAKKADRTRRRETPDEEDAPGLAARLRAAVAARPKAVILMVGVVVSFGAISVNALYLQPGKHPAPLFAPHAQVRSAALEPAASVPDQPDPLERVRREAAEAPEAPAPDNLVAAIQTGLKARGFYDDAVDGAMGPATQAAISAYEKQSGLEVTGAPSVGLLASLSAPTPSSRPEPRKAATPSKATVARLQEALVAAGYGPITVDGIYGSETAGAIRRYQLDNGLAVTGSVSEPLLARFGLASAGPEG